MVRGLCFFKSQSVSIAAAAGDKNVYYIAPEEYYGADSRLCTVDGTHPNDLGFYRMAKAIYPVMKKMLKAD